MNPETQKIQIGDKEYDFLFSPHAFIAADMMGIDAFGLLASMGQQGVSQGKQLAAFTTLAWAGILGNHPDVTLQEIQTSLRFDQFPDLVAAVNKAVMILSKGIEGEAKAPTRGRAKK